MKVRALRGATTAAANDHASIEAATSELLQEMLGRNGVGVEQLISVLFTATTDLTADFPAAAARALGIDDVPLLCAQEIEVDGAVERCIRVLMHLETELDRSRLRHVYLNGAVGLRSDLAAE